MKKSLKRMLASALSLTLLASVLPAAPAHAADYTEIDGVYYRGFEVVGCDDDAKEIKILSVANGTSVTKIATAAFKNKDKLETVIIEDGITSINDRAFLNCTALSSVTLPSTLTGFNHSTFSGCTKLESITLPEGMTRLGGRAFMGCTSLKEVVIPSTIDDSYGENGIYGQWFSGCTSLEKVTFNDGATIIPPHAFEGCQDVEIILPDTITTIGASAFKNVKWLTNLGILPKTITSIEQYAFLGCTGLTTLDNLAPTVKQINQGAFSGCTGLVIAQIPEAVTYIGNSCFSDCTALKIVTFSNNLSRINDKAFANCTSLENVYIPNSAKEFGNNVFIGCSDTLTVHCNQNAGAASSAAADDIYHTFSGRWTYKELISRDTYYICDTGTLMTDNYITLIAKYSIDTARTGACNNIRLAFTIPKDCRYIEGSAYIGREKAENVALGSNYVVVSGLGTSGYVTIRLEKAGARDVVSRAVLSFGARYTSYSETLGTVCDKVRTISLRTQPYTNSDTITVSGIATPSSDVNIYVDGEYALTAKSNKTGTYSADVPLADPEAGKDYTIRAIIDNDESTMREAVTEYNPEKPVLKSFVLYPNNHINPGECINLLQDGKIIRVDFWPVYHYFFKAEYTNPDAIEKVYITSVKGNDRKTIVAEYNEESGLFESYDIFDPDNMNYVPGDIEITYTLKLTDKVYEEKYEEFMDKVSDFPEFKEKLDMVVLPEESFEDGEKKQISANLVPKDGGTPSKIVITHTPDSNYNEFGSIDENTIKTPGGYLKFIGDMNSEEQKILFHNISDNICYAIALKNTPFGLAMNTVSLIEDIATLTEMQFKATQLDFPQSLAVMSIIGTYEALLLTTYTITYFVGMCDAIGDPFPCLGELTSAVNFLWNELLTMIRGASGLTDGPGIFIHLMWRIDPSGYVYEGVTSNRLEGVKATVYYKDSETGKAVLWNAEEYDQQNPLYTNADGRYSWMVPEGLWQVKYELDGYETTYSEWLPVPPPQMDVNIGMTSLSAPDIASIEATRDEVKIIFTQYMKPETMENIKVSCNEENLSYTLTYPEDETTLFGEVLAKSYVLKLSDVPEDASSYIVSLSSDIMSYADVAMNDKDYTLAISDDFMSISIPESIPLAIDEISRIKVESSGFEENDSIRVESNVDSVVSVDDVTSADGIFYITLKAKAIGNANITITLPNSEKVVTEAIVSPTSDEKITFNDVTFSDNSASVTLTSNQSDSRSGTLIFAEYDKDGRLLSVKCKDFDTASTKNVSFDNLTHESEHYNIFVLDSFSSLSPLCEKY